MEKIYVVHVEDEPWDYEHILRELKVGVYRRLSGEDRSTVKLFRDPKNESEYPLKWSLNWDNSRQTKKKRFGIDYWFVTNSSQLTEKIGPPKKTLYIVDVLRVNDKSEMISDWRSRIEIIHPKVDNFEKQVRLYTAYDVEDDGGNGSGESDVGDKNLPMPEVLEKGDTQILEFILGFMDFADD